MTPKNLACKKPVNRQEVFPFGIRSGRPASGLASLTPSARKNGGSMRLGGFETPYGEYLLPVYGCLHMIPSRLQTPILLIPGLFATAMKSL